MPPALTLDPCIVPVWVSAQDDVCVKALLGQSASVTSGVTFLSSSPLAGSLFFKANGISWCHWVPESCKIYLKMGDVEGKTAFCFGNS